MSTTRCWSRSILLVCEITHSITRSLTHFLFCSDSLDTWLLPPDQPNADIYAVGFQEMVDLNTMNVVLSGTESTIRALYWQEKIKEVYYHSLTHSLTA